jgi:hypothetical protein
MIPLNTPTVISTATDVALSQMNFGGLETASGKAVSFIVLLLDANKAIVQTLPITLTGQDYNDFYNNDFNTSEELLAFVKEKTGLDFPVNEEDADSTMLNVIVPVVETPVGVINI